MLCLTKARPIAHPSPHAHKDIRKAGQPRPATTVQTNSIKMDRSGIGISYSSSKQLKGQDVACLLAASTSCAAPDILHGSMAQAAMLSIQRNENGMCSAAATQEPAIVLYPPPSPSSAEEPDALKERASRNAHHQQGNQWDAHCGMDELLLRRIEKGTLNSSAFVAAFAERVDLYAHASSSDSSASTKLEKSSSSWLERITAPQQRSLIGLARASSDESLVATMHEVCVHPSYRGRGVGRRLVRLLLRQLLDKGIYDIGAVVPSEVQGFYLTLGFEKDREQSTVMKIGSWKSRSQEPCSTHPTPAVQAGLHATHLQPAVLYTANGHASSWQTSPRLQLNPVKQQWAFIHSSQPALRGFAQHPHALSLQHPAAILSSAPSTQPALPQHLAEVPQNSGLATLPSQHDEPAGQLSAQLQQQALPQLSAASVSVLQAVLARKLETAMGPQAQGQKYSRLSSINPHFMD